MNFQYLKEEFKQLINFLTSYNSNMYNNIYPNLHIVTHTNILYKSNMYTITYSTLPYDKLTSYHTMIQ